MCALAPVSVSGRTRCLFEVAVAAAGEDEKLGAGTQLLTALCSHWIPLCHSQAESWQCVGRESAAAVGVVGFRFGTFSSRLSPSDPHAASRVQEGCDGMWALGHLGFPRAPSHLLYLGLVTTKPVAGKTQICHLIQSQ